MSKLRWLFLDLDAYFASVEEQDHPDLRGRPVAVAHVLADSATLIAVSYPGRASGVQTGMRIAEARSLCPDLRVMASREARYAECHRAIVAAVQSILPVSHVASIDEMYCALPPADGSRARAKELAKAMQCAIKEQVGVQLSSSIGLAPNRFLAKVAGRRNKPAGITIIQLEDLPKALYSLSLRD